MIHLLTQEKDWAETARVALSCDIIFTQPLFAFGLCNTGELRAALLPGQRLIVFSSPDFEAYFPDAFSLRHKEKLIFPASLDWDSSIIFSCFLQGVSVFDVPDIYRGHALFSEASMRRTLADSLEYYAGRERGVDLSTGAYVFRHYASRKLFHTPRHPSDSFLSHMLGLMAGFLGLDCPASPPEPETFSFNQWPIITRRHAFFRFAEQDFFVVGGKNISLEDMAMAYYTFYEFHPHIVDANRDRMIAL